ncbi:PREDICTED: probable G-protein coupled receptor AH9.1 [Priapulus caudatus]|uniref:Probable G-protein coupled receptor AH9.1 n=1 Tax=Priapulus caudatus TaxID=37621 RepID=A0ABM1F2J9_PRICU|nr:PREDICTED: probable G-protein coupled receptor AH9.1 [Priapulus caudatus]
MTILFGSYYLTQVFIHNLDVSVHLARFRTYVYLPGFNSLAAVSNTLVMIVTVDRWWSICHPLRAIAWRSFAVARATVAAVYVLCFALHVPELFTYTVGRWRDLATNKTYYSADWNSDIHKTGFYRIAWPWSKVILTKLLPIVVVMVMNPLIFRAFYVAGRRRRQLSAAQTGSAADLRQQAEQRHLTVLLITLSVTFVVCVAPQVVLSLVDRMVPQQQLITNYDFQVFRDVANFLELVNVSVNFYLYSVSNASFRRALCGPVAGACRAVSRLPSRASTRSSELRWASGTDGVYAITLPAIAAAAEKRGASPVSSQSHSTTMSAL